jgi:hypothetical protein
MSPSDDKVDPLARDRNDGTDGEQAFDAHTRAMAQEAGLDRDLESQVPPRYGRFSTIVISILAILAVLTLLWILL